MDINDIVDEEQCNVGCEYPREDGADDRVRVKDISHHPILQDLLQILGSRPMCLRIPCDLRQYFVEGFAGPGDNTQRKVQEKISLVANLIRRRSIGVGQIRVHGDRD